MEISDDLLLHKIWKFLPVETLVNYCASNKTFNEICNDSETWMYLLKRDYGVIFKGADPKEEYMEFRNYQMFLRKIGLNLNKSISDYTFTEILNIKHNLRLEYVTRRDEIVAVATVIMASYIPLSLGDSLPEIDNLTVTELRSLFAYYYPEYDKNKIRYMVRDDLTPKLNDKVLSLFGFW